jgi:NAD(P)-dependent dehydrogenase (short-subunit alcohol dehydrogenase family)
VAETVRAVEQTFGKIDLLINNAGVGGPVGPAWQVDAEDWWSCLEIYCGRQKEGSRALSQAARGDPEGNVTATSRRLFGVETVLASQASVG